MDADEDGPLVSTYRAYGMRRWALLGGYAAFLVVGVFGFVASSAERAAGSATAPEPWFFPVWFAFVLFSGVVFLGPTALELELTGDRLRWRSPLLKGDIGLADLRSVRPLGPYGVVAVLSTATRPRVLAWATEGFAAFMDDVVAVAPHVQVRHGIYQRTGDRLANWRRRSKGQRRSR